MAVIRKRANKAPARTANLLYLIAIIAAIKKVYRTLETDAFTKRTNLVSDFRNHNRTEGLNKSRESALGLLSFSSLRAMRLDSGISSKKKDKNEVKGLVY